MPPIPTAKMLTTLQAADILAVDLPYLISLIEKGDLAAEIAWGQRKIRGDVLYACKQARDERRRAALAALAAIDSEIL